MAEEIKVRVLTKKKEEKKPIQSPPTVSKNKKDEPLKKERKDGHASDVRRRVVFLAVKIAFFIALCYIVFFVIFGVTRMKDNGMYPAVRDGDMLMYYRLEANYGNGDIVVADVNGEERVMRVIASGGQELDIKEEDGLLVDGQPSSFQAFYETIRAGEYKFKYPYKVSKDCYFLMNDYRSNTNDSRSFGEVCKENIKGRLISKLQVRDL